MPFSVASSTEQADFYNLEGAATFGQFLPIASASAFEQVLPHNPRDVVSRARLLGHYWMYYKKTHSSVDDIDEEWRARRTEHILWFIENAPDCVFAGDDYLSCDSRKDSESYEKILSAWKKQIKQRRTCAQSRVNFALFLFDSDANLAETILREVLKIDANNE